ncbi:MAG: 30S ribosome-binding factor RbfA [Mycoplasma sp.]|nr:30S ribosome-binding factor RbfA [Mycoplasma sp.]
MASINVLRMQKSLMILLSEIINNDLTNANLTLTTVTEVKLSKDLGDCIVFVSFFSKPDDSLKILNSASSFIRGEVARRSSMRRIPHFIFKLDTSFEKGQQIEDILKKISDNKK